MARWMPFLVVLVTVGCQPAADSTPTTTHAAAPPSLPTPGLHNVLRVTDRLYSGSSPDGEEGFRSLVRLGVRTVVSVDGARPDVEQARRHGLRYVHLPIGYDGVPQEQALRLARAVRDLPGPIYLHCHHGKHRGPAAAAVVRLFLDDQCRPEDAVAVMTRAGTDRRYTGLYAAPRGLTRPTREELDRVPAVFPETAEVAALAQVMVAIDERWDHLKQVKAAGWRTPPGHPDIDPPHEALQLVEHYREMARLPEVQSRSEEFRHWLAEAEQGAAALEQALRSGKANGTVEPAKAAALYRQAEEGCARCHARYRDVPQRP